MEKLTMCRICLAEDIRMVTIKKQLQEVYETLTMTLFQAGDNRPIQVCFICCARLRNCYNLQMICVYSERRFTDMLDSNMEKPLKLEEFNYQLHVTPVMQLDISDYGNIENKVFNSEVLNEKSEIMFEVEFKSEETDDIKDELVQENDIVSDNVLLSSDPEDDLPLKVIKKETDRRRKKRKKRELRTAIETNLKLDASELILSKDEQLANLLARCNTLNYKMSPYKCDLCYKGFVDTKAYENHIVKHDETSGGHVCDICRMRYKTAQLLRTHTVTAHSRLYQCNKCEHTSHTANQARIHDRWHSGYTYECQLCGHKFRKPTSYLSHMRKSHPTEHVCEMCGESFVGKHGLQMHKKKSHKHHIDNADGSAGDSFCNECNIQFYNTDAWKRHILCSVKHTLNNQTRTSCQICGWSGDSSSLVNHMRAHSKALRGVGNRTRDVTVGIQQTNCAQCGLNFVSRSKLQNHINRIHLGLKYNKNIVCEVCGKHCSSNATLRYHQRTHTGERPYSCANCSKHFVDSNQLRIHTRTHTGEKPYICAVCTKRFSQKPALNRHYRVHTGDKPYSCQYCSRTFSQSNSLKLHVRTVHLKLPANNRKKLPAVPENSDKSDGKQHVISETREIV